MNQITNVGQLRALLSGLPDDAIVRPTTHFRMDQPGLYLIRWAAGTCNAEYVEMFVQPEGIGNVTVVSGPSFVKADHG